MDDHTPEKPEVKLFDQSSKDQVWDRHKSLAWLVRRAYLASPSHRQVRRGERMNECASWLLFELLQNDKQETRHKLFKANFCRVRLCPVCMWRKSMAWRARIYEGFPKLKQVYEKPLAFLHVVFTVPNCEIQNLNETIKHMNSSWNRMTSRKGFPGLGFLRSMEVTRNRKDGTVHPHIHVLLAVPETYFKSRGYLNREKLRQRWARALGVSPERIIHPFVARVKPGKGGLEGAVLEVTKYAVKMHGFHDMLRSPERRDWFLELDRQLERTRTVALGGLIRSVMREDEISEGEMLIEGENALESILAILRYDWSGKHYIRTETRSV